MLEYGNLINTEGRKLASNNADLNNNNKELY